MAKKLISLQNVQELCAGGEKEICLSSSYILTPSAQDFLKTQGIAIRFVPDAPPLPKESKGVEEALAQRITEILIHQHGLRDKELITRITAVILEKTINS